MDIQFSHVNRFQVALAQQLREMDRSAAAATLVERFNRKGSFETEYHGRFLFGFCDEHGVFRPAEAEGAQLSEPVYDYTTFRVVEFRPAGPVDRATEVILQDEAGENYSANAGRLLDWLDDHAAAETFQAAYQLNFEIPGQPARIELLKVRSASVDRGSHP